MSAKDSSLRVYFMGRFYSKAVYQKCVYQKMYVIKNDCSLKIKNSIMLLLGLKCKL